MLLVRDVIQFTGKTKRGKAVLADLGIKAGHDARIIWIANSIAWLIDLASPKIRTWQMAIGHLDTLVAYGDVVHLTGHGYDFAPIEDSFTKEQRQRRDVRMATIKPLLEKVPDIFDRAYRGHAVSAAAKSPGSPCATTIHETLRRFWVHGMTPGAIMPRFDQIGRTRHAAREQNYRPLGRPREAGRGVGINVTKEIKAAFEKAAHRHYRSNATMSLKAVWKEVVADLATTLTRDGRTKKVYETIDETKLGEKAPTYRQFCYWYHKSGRYLSDKESRLGTARYQKDHRAILASSTVGLAGIGSRFEVDATMLDVACVSEHDRRRYVGRPTLHLVTDVYSKMIVGFYLGFLSSGWEAASLAMRNVLEDKKQFCARYDIQIEREDWPCSGYLPSRILGDRGEYEGYDGTKFAAKTGIDIEVTAPYRGDLKGTVEKRFHMIHQLLKPMVPGVVTKNHAEKGDTDYRRQAKLNLRELTQIMIHTILYLNNKHVLANHHRRKAMVDARVAAIPRDMWKQAMEDGSTELRAVRDDRIGFLMLPVAEASVTSRGLKFRGIQYESEMVRSNRWAELARAGKRHARPAISYDPNSTDQIFLHREDGSYEICPISPVSEAYAGITFEEVQKIRETVKADDLRNQVRDIGGLRELRRVVEQTLAAPFSESSIDLDNGAIKGGRTSKKEEAGQERKARGTAESPIPDVPEHDVEAPGFGHGYAAYCSSSFKEDPLDLGDDDGW